MRKTQRQEIRGDIDNMEDSKPLKTIYRIITLDKYQTLAKMVLS